jgi:hypothetical protein
VGGQREDPMESGELDRNKKHKTRVFRLKNVYVQTHALALQGILIPIPIRVIALSKLTT